MRIWLTLDSAWTYLIDGVGGCGMWISEPSLDPDRGWSNEHQPHDCIRGGRALRQHSAVEMIDTAIMLHFVPELDLGLERWERFALVRQRVQSASDLSRCSWKLALDVTPEEWFDLARRAGESNLAEARHAQKAFDLPF